MKLLSFESRLCNRSRSLCYHTGVEQIAKHKKSPKSVDTPEPGPAEVEKRKIQSRIYKGGGP